VTGRLLLLEELPAREDTEASWASFAADLTSADRRALERFCARMPEIIPAMPPVLTHGDLWIVASSAITAA
jgi:hypothetical protein